MSRRPPARGPSTAVGTPRRPSGPYPPSGQVEDRLDRFAGREPVPHRPLPQLVLAELTFSRAPDSTQIHYQLRYGGSLECCGHACAGCCCEYCCDVQVPLDRPLPDPRTSNMTRPTTPASTAKITANTTNKIRMCQIERAPIPPPSQIIHGHEVFSVQASVVQSWDDDNADHSA